MLRWKWTQQIHVVVQETFHKLAKGNDCFCSCINRNSYIIHTDGQVLEETVRLWVTEEAAIVAEHKTVSNKFIYRLLIAEKQISM